MLAALTAELRRANYNIGLTDISLVRMVPKPGKF